MMYNQEPIYTQEISWTFY